MSIRVKITHELDNVKGLWIAKDEHSKWNTPASAVADGRSPEQMIRMMLGWDALSNATMRLLFIIDTKEDFLSLQDQSHPHRPFFNISPGNPVEASPWSPVNRS